MIAAEPDARSRRAPQTVYTHISPVNAWRHPRGCARPKRTTRTFVHIPRRNGVAARSSRSHARDRDHRMASEIIGWPPMAF